jgi:uncharacterized membrane protein YgcG
MIEEIEGILTLLTKRPDQRVLAAIATLPSDDIKAYRDSLVDEWKVLNPNKHMLVID